MSNDTTAEVGAMEGLRHCVERFSPEVVTACDAQPGNHLLDHVRSAMAARH